MNTTVKNTKNTTATKTTKNVSKKEGTTMTKKDTETKKTAKTVEPKKAEKTAEPAPVKRIDKKEEVRVAVDKWLQEFTAEAEGNGMKVEVKTWEKIPTCRSLKVDGITYFEIYYSANGARLNAKSKLIPEPIRPEGSNIIQNGLDLTIPTFSEIAPNLTKYADACRKSIADAKKAKEEVKAKKEAERKAKAAETKAAAK